MIKIISKDGSEKIWKRQKKKIEVKKNTLMKQPLEEEVSISILKTNIGLPHETEKKILWVTDNYRTNPLSLKSGGSNIIVEYNKKVLGYDKIKRPSAYIKYIMDKDILNIYGTISRIEKLKILKKEVSVIYALKHDGDIYQEVWNNKDSLILPWETLKSFDLPKE